MESYNLCIIKPNKSAFSETFVNEHIKRLGGNKKVIYGGSFPLYDHNGKLLINSKIKLLLYLIQKRILKQQNIHVRTQSLIDYFKRENINVVFTEYGMVGALVTDACKQAGIPLVIHFHGADVHHRKTVAKYLTLYKKAFQYCSGIIAVSKDMVEALKKLGAPPSKISYIPCGVDLNRFVPVHSLPSANNFLSIGRFVAKKSPISVVKAFEKVLQTLPDSKLWMAGTGPLFPKVKKYIIDHNLKDQIILTGVIDQDEIKSLMHTAKCFVQHSVTAASGDMEGSPLTIVEASASGLPVVSTRHAGIKEAVIHEKTGYLVEEHDIDSMAEYMIKIAKDINLATMLGKNGAAHIQANYNIETSIKNLDKVIQSSIIK